MTNKELGLESKSSIEVFNRGILPEVGCCARPGWLLPRRLDDRKRMAPLETALESSMESAMESLLRSASSGSLVQTPPEVG